jgi:hypothetical protein
MHWSFRPVGGLSFQRHFCPSFFPYWEKTYLSFIFILLRSDFITSPGNRLHRHSMVIMIWYWRRHFHWEVTSSWLLNANDIIDSTSFVKSVALLGQYPYIQECDRPRPSLSSRPYKYALTRTISFGLGHLNIESRVISLLRDRDTAPHCYRQRPSLSSGPYNNVSTRTISFDWSDEAGLGNLNIESRGISLFGDTDTAYRIVILMLWRIWIEGIYTLRDVD